MRAAGALIVAAFVAFLIAWQLTADTLDVPDQVTYLVAGGLGGTVLLVAGVSLLNVQLGRRLAARERRALEAVVVEAWAVLQAAETAATRPAGSAPTRSSQRRGAARGAR